MQDTTSFSDIDWKHEKEQDIGCFKEVIRKLASKHNISFWEVIKIIEFCFGGRDTGEPGSPLRFVKFKKDESKIKKSKDQKDRSYPIIQYGEIQKILNIPNRELEKAVRRTVPKLKQLDFLWNLRKKYPSPEVENGEILVIKNKYGVYKQIDAGDDNIIPIEEV